MTVDRRYPIGPWVSPGALDATRRTELIAQIEEAPARLRDAVRGLSDAQLDTPYREGGWTVRQVVHHLPDSHVNAYVRTKLALTEEEPVIRPYDEVAWANLPDGSGAPIEPSLALLDALHARWVLALRAAPESSFKRTYWHPVNGLFTLDELLSNYAWHGRHHVAHITSLYTCPGMS